MFEMTTEEIHAAFDDCRKKEVEEAMAITFANPTTWQKLKQVVDHRLNIVLWDEKNGDRYEISNVYIEDDEVNVDLKKVN